MDAMSKTKFRTEKDSMGELKVPADALWGAQTQRAVDNFPISGLTMPRSCRLARAKRESYTIAAPTRWGHGRNEQDQISN